MKWQATRLEREERGRLTVLRAELEIPAKLERI